MLKEALELLVGLGQQTKQARILKIDGDPTKVYVETRDGVLLERDVLPAFRNHTVLSLEDLIAAAKSAFSTQPVLWHSNGAVVLLTDGSTRRDRVTLPLTLSNAFIALNKQSKDARYSPKELAMFLRTELAGCMFARDIIQSLRKMKWRSSSETRTEFSQGRESIGRDVEAELQTDVQLPEEIEIDIPIYSTVGEDNLWPVKCLVEADVATQRIVFCAIPGELEKAMMQQQAGIRERLEQALPKVAIFAGTP